MKAIRRWANTDVVVDFSHNDLLNISDCTGLVELALCLAFVAVLLVRCLRRVNTCSVLLIFVAGILGYLAYSFFVFSIAIVPPLFRVMAGLADRRVRQMVSEGTKKAGGARREGEDGLTSQYAKEHC